MDAGRLNRLEDIIIYQREAQTWKIIFNNGRSNFVDEIIHAEQEDVEFWAAFELGNTKAIRASCH